MILKRNAVQCNYCKKVIESKHRHDFRAHQCLSAGLVSRTYNHELRQYEPAYPYIAVDGGLEYSRILGEPGDYTSIVEYNNKNERQEDISGSDPGSSKLRSSN